MDKIVYSVILSPAPLFDTSLKMIDLVFNKSDVHGTQPTFKSCFETATICKSNAISLSPGRLLHAYLRV